MIDRLLGFCDRCCLMVAGMGAICLACLFLLGLVEILARNLLNISLSFTVEYSGYLVALSLLLASGHALNCGNQVRVGLLRERTPVRWRASLDLAATLLALVICSGFAAAMIDYGIGTAIRGTLSYFPSRTPLGLPQLILCLGPLSLVLALLARLLRLVTGRYDRAEAR